MMNWSNRKIKVFARESFFENVNPKYSYLTLPGAQCLDVAAGIDCKVISPQQTKIVAVERAAEEFSNICNWFAHNWKGNKPRLINSDLNKVTELEPLDLVFLDYLGNITASDAFWIKKYLAPALLPNAHLGMTVTTTFRNNKLYPAVKNLIQKQFPKYYKEKLIYIRERGDYPKSILEFLTIYYIMIDCYLLENHNCKISMEYYGEPQSSNVMILFKLLNINHGTFLTPEEDQIKHGITAIVKSGLKGICISKTVVPIFPQKVSCMKTEITGNEVVNAVMKAKTAGTKMAATKLKQKFIVQQAAKGKDPKWIEAGLKARISRLKNGN